MRSTSALFGFYCLLLLALIKDTLQNRPPAPAAEFGRHRTAVPQLQHGRERRRVASSRRQNGLHEEELTVTLPMGDGGRRLVLELRLQRELLPRGHTLAYRRAGRAVVRTHRPQELDLCQYQGSIRGVESSWVAVSTCHGLRGALFDGEQLLYIEPSGGDMNSQHYVYRHEDAVRPRACGADAPSAAAAANRTRLGTHPLHRRRRSEQYVLRGPYDANRQSRYVELALVVDHEGYRASGGDLRAVHAECKDIANIMNAMYAPLNIFIALVHVEVWTERDQIVLLSKGDDTLSNFLAYRRTDLLRRHPNDNAQLLTRQRFDGDVVGKAQKGTMCTYEYSGGINTNHSSVLGLVATTIAHEMGHNFGMEHDSPTDCSCPDNKCIMSPSSNTVSPTHWSSCSQEALALSFEHGLDYCLRNKPSKLFDTPTCGNGFVEEGEQCDCGPAPGACGACCRPDTCELRHNATCATGLCCDLDTCSVRAAGSECRAAARECDLPEYCTGYSEFCPDDVHKMDSLPCDDGQAFCSAGWCRSHSDQCRLLWGPSGTRSHDKCYAINRNGSSNGNCGLDRLQMRYERCEPQDALCGLLHCRHLNEQLEFGVELVSKQSHTFINIDGTIIPCRTALVDLGLDVVDPGLVPDGAKCGLDKMCEKQKCVSVESVRARVAAAPDSVCPSDCSGHGVCNSKGHCHCERGFAPPRCELPGAGGSHHSGPASDPAVQRKFMVTMYVMFLGVVPAAALLLLLAYYSRRRLLPWWRRPRARKPSQSPKKGSLQRRLSRGASKLAASFHPPHAGPPPPLAPLAPLAADDMSSSLLRAADSDSPGGGAGHLFGHFKGFSLTPLEKSQVNGARDAPPVAVIGGLGRDHGLVSASVSDAVRSARIQPAHRSSAVQRAAPASPARAAPPAPALAPPAHLARSGSVQDRIKAFMGADRPDIGPASHGGAAPRPTISSPILEASTCTAKELVSPLQGSKTLGPTRAAPGVPRTTDVPRRPLSMEASVLLKPLPDEPLPKKPKEGISLNRIASFLRQEKARSPVERSHSLPKNPNNQVRVIRSVDKAALRSLQISNPILLEDIALPAGTVPVLADAHDGDEPKQLVGRAQSMRGASVTQRPSIPTFGSMRQAAGAARVVPAPAAGSRPTAPPPPRPERPAPALQAHDYADCVGEKRAPLANINEESPGDNIYAVIEESPPAGSAAPPTKTTAQAPPPGYNTPRAIGGAHAGSSESVGLLGEIVSEIQTRNLDSIYSTSTLARRRREREARGGGGGREGEGEGEYRPAASTTSSGYLLPSAVNVPRRFEHSPAPVPKAPEVPVEPQAPPSPLSKGPNSRIPMLGRQPTPPGLKVHSSTFRNAPPSPKLSPVARPTSANGASPDVVSSCAISTTAKSPDVVNSNESRVAACDGTGKPIPKTFAGKATDKPPAKYVPVLEKKNSAPKLSNPLKPTNVQSAAQKIQGNVAKVTTKVDPTKTSSDNLNKGKPKPVPRPAGAGAGRAGAAGAARGPAGAAAARASTVANLQQKFENRKSVGREPSARK